MNREDSFANLTDRKLISLFQSGNNCAFDCLYKRHYQNVHRYLRNLTRHKEKSEDLTQDVFCGVLICFKENKFMGTNFFSQYLRSLTYYTFLQSIKNSKEMLTDCDFFENMADETVNIQQVLFKEEIPNRLKCLVSTLPKKKLEIIYLHFYDNKVFKDIAEDLNTAQTTILSQYYSSLEKLRVTAENTNFRFAI